MRHPLAKIAATAVAVPLAGALMFAALPASAATSAKSGTVTATAKAAGEDPYSAFSVTVTGPKKAKRGGEITYRIKGVNNGPWTADDYYLGGTLPKNLRGPVYYDGPKGTKCGFFPDGFWCWPPYALEKGESTWLTITVRLKKGATGTATAKLGVNTWNWPTGAEDLSRDELRRIGVKGWYFTKPVKTKIAR
ncbi:hypothetical protein Skr01_31920 [Sphaerisporangium krabiense]|uniref:Putative repeat protein (TIGR01451 family) n=1 Tax=Sphaerisporangium krabiense TaxID=763782 RepID=A0A7W8Z160_9ACTN|nr:DUF11 domain-containing protein [Sphaerisporangium krabiense]MBB5625563.1 putative repeat protein (TIGR01451 family) [Sphaerisporangium krabiense]GII63107.1 hypothetical protein Skr01_31920 [Sphaerisporangium krabiense]